ncbi:TetR/AcrR family transcriptional regulator [Saccharothrix sp. HUAS TT1]|uniref:TetR/AcrR family transcriptional regulator n=1 Tax=unclassified Saccharothrix TaxID=2593673 RepID=UPI00345BE4C7
MSERNPTLREQRRAETQRAIQAHAVRLFTERGYDATAVTDVAEAAGVSPMTVYRHFPTKEDLVLTDRNGPLIAARIAASPAGQPLVRRIGAALVASAEALTGDPAGGAFLLARLRLMITTPALRAKHLDNFYALQQAVVCALGADDGDPDATFHAQAASGACLSAMHTALVCWAEADGRTALPDVMAKALKAAFGPDVLDEGPGVSGPA